MSKHTKRAWETEGNQNKQWTASIILRKLLDNFCTTRKKWVKSSAPKYSEKFHLFIALLNTNLFSSCTLESTRRHQRSSFLEYFAYICSDGYGRSFMVGEGIYFKSAKSIQHLWMEQLICLSDPSRFLASNTLSYSMFIYINISKIPYIIHQYWYQSKGHQRFVQSIQNNYLVGYFVWNSDLGW